MKCICSGALDRNTHSPNYACQLVCISEFSKKKKKRNVCEVGILYNRSRQLKWMYKRKGSDSAARAVVWKYLRYVLRNFRQSRFLLSLQSAHLHLLFIPDPSSSSSCSSSLVRLNLPLWQSRSVKFSCLVSAAGQPTRRRHTKGHL